MQVIDLPLTHSLRRSFAVLSLGGMGLVLLSPVQWPWRLVWLCCWLLAGVVLWRQYSGTRPARLLLGHNGRLSWMLVDGREIQVARCELGTVRPWLVSARLVGIEGQTSNLFVPGGTLHADAHWALRRALIAFRESDSRR